MTSSLCSMDKCAVCLNCCKDTIVPISDADVRRLKKASGLSAEQFVRFIDSSEIDYEPDRDGWINFSRGKRVMGLKQRNEKCIFLDEDGRCSVYTRRPSTCRTYPFDAELDVDGVLVAVSIMRGVECAFTFDDLNHTALQKDARREDRDDQNYYRKLKKWNKRPVKGGNQEYLNFLGLMD